MALKYGIDVSHCQGRIDWDHLADTNPEIKFALIRTGYSYGSRYVDTQFHRNVEGCLDAGIDVYGVYHFSYALSEDDAIKEAKECILQTDMMLLPKTTIIFFDFEYAGEDFCRDNGVVCDEDFLKRVTIAFCNEVRAAGYIPGIYLNVDYYNRLYGKLKWLPSDVKIWGAKWVNYVNGRVLPITDKELETKSKQPPFKFDVWQYGAINVSGIGVVDADVIISDGDAKAEEVKMKSRKSNEEIAAEVVRGEWGNGAERRRRLEEEGYVYRDVQAIVNTYYE